MNFRMFMFTIASLAFVCGCDGKSPWQHKESISPDSKIQSTSQNSSAQSTYAELQYITEPYPVEGVVLGQGWNILLGRKTTGICVNGTKNLIPGGGTTVDFRRLFDKEQIISSQEASANVGFNGGAFGGSVAASFAKSLQLDRSRTNIFAKVLVDKGGWQLTPALQEDKTISQTLRFSSDIEPNSKGFRELCGDGFVIGERIGGRLDLVFGIAGSTEKTSEIAVLNAEANYGPAKGSLALTNNFMKMLMKEDTTLKQLQQGGKLTIPTTPEKALEKIAEFATFPVEGASPLQIIIMPYRGMPEFSQTTQSINIGKLKALFTQQLRLAELSKLYLDAYLNPINYYFPFQKGISNINKVVPISPDSPKISLDDQDRNSLHDELLSDGKALRAASNCLEQVVAWCAVSSSCEFNKLLSEKFKESCEMFSGNLTDYEKYTASQFLPNPFKDIIQKDLITFLELKQENSAKLEPKNSSKLKLEEAYALDTKNALATLKSIKPKYNNIDSKTFTADDTGRSPYWFYMRYLAKAPLIKSETNANPSVRLPGDEYQAVIDLCTNDSTAVECSNISSAILAESTLDKIPDIQIKKPPLPPTPIQKPFLQWVLKKRLYPYSEAFCDMSFQHVMCFGMDELIAISGEIQPLFGTTRGFKVPLPPPQIEQQPPKKEPVDRFRDPCRLGHLYTC